MQRCAFITRKTKETDIELTIDLNGGNISVNSGIGFFDHMLTAFFFYAGIAAVLTCEGDLYVDNHHTVEDIGIVIGLALKEALGSKEGIVRIASCYVPMDEALCFTAIDFSGRAHLTFDAYFPQEKIGNYDSCLSEEFFKALTRSAGLTLHLHAIYGDNAHHITEAMFKAFGLAVKQAVTVTSDSISSTKGTLD